VGDFDSIDQLHYKVRAARFGGSGIQDPRDIRMIHQGKCLTLRLEPSDHGFGVHPELDKLQGHPAADRLFLLCHVNHPAPSLPKLLE
jgi:hypothetical protein